MQIMDSLEPSLYHSMRVSPVVNFGAWLCQANTTKYKAEMNHGGDEERG